MPELPEVETTLRDLRKKILKKTFVDLWCDAKNLIKKPKSFQQFKKEIINKKILDIQRKGKNILFFLNNDKILLVHQKLTGHLLVGRWRQEKGVWIPEKGQRFLSDPANRFIHLIFFLDDRSMLALSDLRKFAKIELWDKEELFNSKTIKEIGIDPLSPEFTFDEFTKRILSSQKTIKQTLMDQSRIAGIGNIYSDEILFAARVHPQKKSSQLKKEELKKIYKSIKQILKKAIELKGESISDYRRPDGSKGEFDRLRKVYRREGERCVRCQSSIKRIKIQGRSSYFCPRCQKL